MNRPQTSDDRPSPNRLQFMAVTMMWPQVKDGHTLNFAVAIAVAM